jgi:hypothetical protein
VSAAHKLELADMDRRKTQTKIEIWEQIVRKKKQIRQIQPFQPRSANRSSGELRAIGKKASKFDIMCLWTG